MITVEEITEAIEFLDAFGEDVTNAKLLEAVAVEQAAIEPLGLFVSDAATELAVGRHDPIQVLMELGIGCMLIGVLAGRKEGPQLDDRERLVLHQACRALRESGWTVMDFKAMESLERRSA